MKKKKKKKNDELKGLPKRERLLKAEEWIEKFEGENIVKAYSKCVGLNLKNSMNELKSLGVKISPDDRTKVQQWVETKRRKREKRKENKEYEQFLMEYEGDSDEIFSFIAGYTSGGAPYGITYEEMEEMEANFSKRANKIE